MLLPAFAFTQVGDVGEVMAGVPCVEQRGVFDGHPAVYRMAVTALPLLVVERLEEHDPAGVQAFNKFERPLGGSRGVVQVCPGCFVVELDGGPVFGKSQTNADGGVHVAIGHVMHDLADGPSAFAIERVPLPVVEAVDGVAELAGKLCKGADGAYHIVF